MADPPADADAGADTGTFLGDPMANDEDAAAPASPPALDSSTATAASKPLGWWRRTFAGRFAALVHRVAPTWRSPIVGCYALFFLATVVEQVFYYFSGLITSDVYATLVSRDRAAFMRVVVVSFLKLLAVAAAIACRRYLDGRLQVLVRRELTTYMQRAYLEDHRYYRLNVVTKAVDNPSVSPLLRHRDQRMTDDVAKLCEELGKVLTQLVIWPFLLAYYCYRSAIVCGWVGPVTSLAFFVLGTGINRLLAGSLVNLYFRQERVEGNFRFLHVHVRTHTEAVAFLDGGAEEMRKLGRSLSRVLMNLRLIVRNKFFVDFATQFCGYLGSVLAYCVVAVPIFSGAYDHLTDPELAALISESAFINMYLNSLLTEVILLANDIAALAGYTYRIDEFLQWLDADAASRQHDKSADTGAATAEEDRPHTPPLPSSVVVALEHVTVAPPGTGAVLLRDVSIAIERGSAWAITGISGCGKSSLLRVLRGLWAPHVGHVRWNTVASDGEGIATDDPRHLLFLPQDAYLPAGTLADMIVYPSNTSETPLEELHLMELLDAVELSHLAERDRQHRWSRRSQGPGRGSTTKARAEPHAGGRRGSSATDVALLPLPASPVPDAPDAEWCRAAPETMLARWSSELSHGERQRLAFARLLFWRPHIAVLDEATSALDPKMAVRLYDRLRELGVTVVSVVHEPTVVAWHTHRLHLSGADGGWSVETGAA